MFPATSLCVGVGALLATACASTPGYRVIVEARDVAPIDPQLVTRLQSIARGSSFKAVYEGKEQTSAVPERVASVYIRTMSERRYDFIEIDIYTYEQEKRIVVGVECLLRGQEEAVKTQIDELADRLATEIAQVAGEKKVSVARERARIPFVF